MTRSGDESKPSDKASIKEAMSFYLNKISSAPNNNEFRAPHLDDESQAKFNENLKTSTGKRLMSDLMSSENLDSDKRMWSSMTGNNDLKVDELRSITREGIYQKNQVPRVLSTRVYEPRSITSTSNYQKVQSSTYPRMLPNGRPDSDEIDKWLEGIKIKNKELDSQVQKKQEKLESLRSQRSRIDVTSQIAASDPVPSEYGYESGQLSRNSSLLIGLFEDEKRRREENKKLKSSIRITEDLGPHESTSAQGLSQNPAQSAPTLFSSGRENIPHQQPRQHQHQNQQGQQYQYQHQYQNPNQQYQHQNQRQGQQYQHQYQHPNQQYQHQNQRQRQQYQQYQHPNQQYQHPNQQYQHPNQQYQHPNQQYPHPLRSRGQFGTAPILFSQAPYMIVYNNDSQYFAYPGVAPQVPAYHGLAPQYSSASYSYQPFFKNTPTTDELNKSQSPQAPKEAENASSSLASKAGTVKSSSPRDPIDSQPFHLRGETLRDETLGDATQVSTKISDYGSAPKYPSESSSYNPWFKNITMTDGSSESKSPEPPIKITEAGAEIFYSNPVYLNLINPEETVPSESKLASSSGLSSLSESLVKIPEAMVGGEEAIFSVKKELEAQTEIYSSEGGKISKSASAENYTSSVPSDETPEELTTILPQTPEHNHRPEENTRPTKEPPKSKNVRYDYKCLSFLSNGLSNIYNGVVSIYNNFPSLPDRFNFKKTMNKNEAGGESSEKLPTKSLSKKEEEKASGFFWRKFAIFSRNNDDNTQKAL